MALRGEKVPEMGRTMATVPDCSGLFGYSKNESINCYEFKTDDLQSPNSQDPLVGQLISQNKELEEQLEYGWQMYDCQGLSLAAALKEIEEAKVKIDVLEQQIAQTALDYSSKQIPEKVVALL